MKNRKEQKLKVYDSLTQKFVPGTMDADEEQPLISQVTISCTSTLTTKSESSYLIKRTNP
jgi:hypothetical protein